MDIMLERILSLIPQKPDGKFVHGAKKEFADKLGIDNSTITQWINGKSKSYRNYLYQLSSMYNVSVEWLKGETDDPAPKAKETGNTDILQLLRDSIPLMSNKDLAEAMRLLVESLGNKE